MFGQDNRVGQIPLYDASLGTGTNPQLSNNMGNCLGIIQCPPGMPQQQIMGMTSNNTGGVRMVSAYTGRAADGINIHPVSFQSSSISNPSNLSLYGHSANLVVPAPVEGLRGTITPPIPLPPMVIIFMYYMLYTIARVHNKSVAIWVYVLMLGEGLN